MTKMTKKTSGWKGIGRSLVVASVGPDSLADSLHGQQVVVVSLEGEPAQLARRRALAPDLVDVVALEATGDDREEVLALSQVLRGRFLSTVLILPRDRWGRRILRTYLGVYRHQGHVVLPELWMAVSVAAQQTWTLGWLRLDRKPREIKEVNRAAAESLSAPVAPPKASKVAEAPPSRTTPWAPPPSMLLELTKAYREER